MSGRFSTEAIFKAVDRMSAPIAAMHKRTTAFIESTEKGLRKVSSFNDTIGSGLKRAGAMAIGTSVAAAAIARDIVMTGAEFDKTLVAAAAKFDPAIKRGTAGFEALRIAAEDIGERTEFNALQAAQGLKELAASGFEAEQAIAVLPGVVDLATASEVDLGAATEMATKSLGAFGLKTKDSAQLAKNLARVTDVMAMSAGKTEASMGGLFETIKEGGPISKAAGASMETFMAMAAKLAGAGIEGSVAGTTLKNVFSTFSTKKGTKELAALGIKTKDANGKMRDALDILGDLEKKTAGMGSAKRLGLLEGIFGKIPLAGVATLLDQGTASIRELRGELEKSTGKTKELAGAMRDTVAGDIDEFTSAIDGVKVALFTTNNGPIRDVIQSMTKWVRANKALIVQKVGDAIKWIGDNLPAIVMWVERIAKGVAIFWAFSTAVKAMTLMVQGYQAAASLAQATHWLFLNGLKGTIVTSKATGGAIATVADELGLFSKAAREASGKQGLAGLREGLNAGALGKQINGITSTLGWLGMLGAAAAVGAAIGLWLNDTFELDKKLEGLIQKMTGLDKQIRASRGLDDPKGTKVLAGGAKIGPKGEIRSLGSRPEERWDIEAGKAFKRNADTLTKGLHMTPAMRRAYAARRAQEGMAPEPQIASPQERTASSVTETISTQKAEITIKDESGKASITKQPGRGAARLKLQQSGAFQ